MDKPVVPFLAQKILRLFLTVVLLTWESVIFSLILLHTVWNLAIFYPFPSVLISRPHLDIISSRQVFRTLLEHLTLQFKLAGQNLTGKKIETVTW